MKETGRLLLKEYDEKYIVKAHENFFSSEETAKYVLWRPTNSPQEVKDKLEYWISVASIDDIVWLIIKKDDDEPIGFICANCIGDNIYGDVGIAIGEKYLRKGYATEALAELIRHLKNNGAKELHYSHFRENDASKALALKFGFKYYKVGKRVRRHDNKEFDELFYVLNLVD